MVLNYSKINIKQVNELLVSFDLTNNKNDLIEQFSRGLNLLMQKI